MLQSRGHSLPVTPSVTPEGRESTILGGTLARVKDAVAAVSVALRERSRAQKGEILLHTQRRATRSGFRYRRIAGSPRETPKAAECGFEQPPL